MAVRGITLCVTRGELAQGLVWVGMWALGVCVCVCVALGSAWVTYDLHMEKMRCCTCKSAIMECCKYLRPILVWLTSVLNLLES